MYLYNSATHKKEEFKTHTPGHVEMYTCGPTVYHFAHIGNLRSYIIRCSRAPSASTRPSWRSPSITPTRFSRTAGS